MATTAAAIELGRPVKFIADRLESFVSDIHARENSVKARMAVSKAGEIQAFDIDVLSGAGAYSQYPRTSVFEANQILNITGGPYRHKHLRARATVVYLNKPPTSQYRAVGHPIGNAVGEHLVDRAAAALGIDPIEIRRRNVMPDDAYPAVTASGIKLKDLSHQRCLDVAGRAHELRRAARASRPACASKGIHRGIGIACFIKGTAPGPQGYYGTGGAPISLQDACVIKLEPNGGVICAVGVTEQGQGTDTIMGQIAATALGVPMESVRVISGDTDAVALRRRHLRLARGGHRRRGGLPGRARPARRRSSTSPACCCRPTPRRSTSSTAWSSIAPAAPSASRSSEIGRIGHFQLGELPNSVQPMLSHTRRFRLVDDLYIFTNGIHGAYVEVDTDTGFVRLLKHWVVEDCGRVINPQLADEQVRGGCVQGLGGALYEHCLYDEAGQLTNGTMADYLVPMAAEMPDIDVAHVQTLSSRVGARRQGRRRIRHRRRPRRGHERRQRRAAALRRPRDDAADDAGGDPHGARQDLTDVIAGLVPAIQLSRSSPPIRCTGPRSPAGDAPPTLVVVE